LFGPLNFCRVTILPAVGFRSRLHRWRFLCLRKSRTRQCQLRWAPKYICNFQRPWRYSPRLEAERRQAVHLHEADHAGSYSSSSLSSRRLIPRWPGSASGRTCCGGFPGWCGAADRYSSALRRMTYVAAVGPLHKPLAWHLGARDWAAWHWGRPGALSTLPPFPIVQSRRLPPQRLGKTKKEEFSYLQRKHTLFPLFRDSYLRVGSQPSDRARNPQQGCDV
jgi:hypothetical protein